MDTLNTKIYYDFSQPIRLGRTMFEKIPIEQFAKDCGMDKDDPKLIEAWENIKLPRRATPDSAGYDFYVPQNVCLNPEKETVFATGIRVQMCPGWFLMCVPRSGLGFKYGVRLRNSTGIIDADYYYADNFGHIMASVTTEIPVSLKAGDRFMQGIFVPFGVTTDDEPINATRRGGFGSTGGGT